MSTTLSGALAAVLAVLLVPCAATGVPGNGGQLDRHATLDTDGRVQLWWSTRSDGMLLRFSVADVRPGWYVAFGWTRSGGMNNADITLVLLKRDGTITLQDAFSRTTTVPTVDARQDVRLLSGKYNGTTVDVTLERQEACDPQDVAIFKNSAINVIWAVGRLAEHMETPEYHGVRRGQRSVNFYTPDEHLDGATTAGDTDEQEKFVDILANDVQLPDDTRTYYFCRILQLPRFQSAVHAVGFRGLVQPGHEAVVHHMILYECTVPARRRTAFASYASTHNGTQCYSPNMPVDWGRCGHILAVWAVGGSGERLPDEVGVPLQSADGSPIYYMLEIHYDNALRRGGLTDRSGVRLFYTSRLRRYEAGLLNVGHDISPTQIIPPRQRHFTSVGVCSAACTDSHLPSSGVLIYSVLLHSHLAGVSMRLRHVHADGSEAPPLAQDLGYNFNYQQARRLHEPRRLMPGDQLLLECVYNSSGRDNVTFGGVGVRNEMCLAFVSYYPRSELSICWSSPQLGDALTALGVTTANAYGVETTAAAAGDMIQRVIDQMDSFARAQWDMQQPLPAATTSGGDSRQQNETGRHLLNVALQDQRVISELRADNVSALEAMGVDELPESLQTPYLMLKDVLVISPRRWRMRTLFEFLTVRSWPAPDVNALQHAALARFRAKCVQRNGSVVNLPAAKLRYAPLSDAAVATDGPCGGHALTLSGGFNHGTGDTARQTDSTGLVVCMAALLAYLCV